jgi:site-specific recombinase XerD
MIEADIQTLNEGKFCQSKNYQELKNTSNMAPLNIIKNFFKFLNIQKIITPIILQ